jgi:hypothetical protein
MNQEQIIKPLASGQALKSEGDAHTGKSDSWKAAIGGSESYQVAPERPILW